MTAADSINEKFYSAIEKRMAQEYPSVREQGYSKTDIMNIISPFFLEIGPGLFNHLSAAVKALYRLAHRPEYSSQIKLSEQEQKLLKLKTKNSSLLMAYDFHLSSDRQEAKLVEINTNASGYLLSGLGYVARGGIAEGTRVLEDLKASFLAEFGSDQNTKFAVSIMDEAVEKQKMYIEFLMYKDLLNSWGIEASIVSTTHISSSEAGELHDSNNKMINKIYNRYCDFTLTETASKKFLNAYINNRCQFSPHPKEYILLADKERLIEWSKPAWWQEINLSEKDKSAIQRVLLISRSFSDFSSRDEIWRQRKKLFFKPKNSFGGKATYRGKSITKGTFEKIMAEDGLAQEYFPADELDEDTISSQGLSGGGGKWKYDLRCYVYKDRIQQLAARFYQGQVTNFSKKYSGFAPVFVRDSHGS